MVRDRSRPANKSGKARDAAHGSRSRSRGSVTPFSLRRQSFDEDADAELGSIDRRLELHGGDDQVVGDEDAVKGGDPDFNDDGDREHEHERPPSASRHLARELEPLA